MRVLQMSKSSAFLENKVTSKKGPFLTIFYTINSSPMLFQVSFYANNCFEEFITILSKALNMIAVIEISMFLALRNEISI